MDVRHFIHVRTLRADGGSALIRVDMIGAIVESYDKPAATAAKAGAKGRMLLLVYLTNNTSIRVIGETIETMLSKMSQAAAKEFTVIRNASAEAAMSLPQDEQDEAA